MLICIAILNRLLIVKGIMDGSVPGQNVYPGARPMGGGRAGERERRGPEAHRREGRSQLRLRGGGPIIWSLVKCRCASPVCSTKHMHHREEPSGKVCKLRPPEKVPSRWTPCSVSEWILEQEWVHLAGAVPQYVPEPVDNSACFLG